MSWETSGFQELLEDVAAMAARLDTEDGEGTAARSILAHAAVPIHEQMQQNASTDPQRRTGRLYRSIQIGKVKKKRGGGQRITIGVHRQAEGAFYSTPVEFGHGGPAPAPPHPFVRPAFDVKADEAYARVKEGLRKAISDKNLL